MIIKVLCSAPTGSFKCANHSMNSTESHLGAVHMVGATAMHSVGHVVCM